MPACPSAGPVLPFLPQPADTAGIWLVASAGMQTLEGWHQDVLLNLSLTQAVALCEGSQMPLCEAQVPAQGQCCGTGQGWLCRRPSTVPAPCSGTLTGRISTDSLIWHHVNKARGHWHSSIALPGPRYSHSATWILVL